MSDRLGILLIAGLVAAGGGLALSAAMPPTPRLAPPEAAAKMRLSPAPESSRQIVLRTGGAWVFDRRLDRHTCPSFDCGVVGQQFFAEQVTVLETSGDWVRITKPYDASCVAGRSEYVDTGKASCDPTNGINNGMFAEWVQIAGLTATEPPLPGGNTTGVAALIKNSDDFDVYEQVFVDAVVRAVHDGLCTLDDFKNNGGWIASQNFKPKPYYFGLCGDAKVYLDASTGRVWRG